MQASPLRWIGDDKFELDGCSFTIDLTPGPNRRPSEDGDFTIVKNRLYLNRYLDLQSVGYKKILELGIFQGGSFVFFDKLFRPDKIVGVDISRRPLQPLDRYIAGRDGAAKVYYGTSQDNTAKLDEIVAEDFGGEVDLIVDDASHTYALTRASFLALFPKLKPGGLYIIEDWAWSFKPAHQDPAHPWHKQPALVNLLIELMQDVAMNNAIANMQIFSTMALVRKSLVRTAPLPLQQSGLRGRPLPSL